MVGHRARLAEGRLVLAFAPSTPYFLLLKRIGEFFPKGAKVSWPPCAQCMYTRAYMSCSALGAICVQVVQV